MSTGDPDADKPGWIPEPDPGKCPRQPGCTCTWTKLDYSWLHGKNRNCPICN